MLDELGRGLDKDMRITVVGRGSREPVAGNDSDSSRSQNRRVEIFLSDSAA